MTEVRVTNRCPKCKGQSFIVDTTIQIDTQREFQDGALVFKADLCGLHEDVESRGTCSDCGHKWRFRNPSLNEV